MREGYGKVRLLCPVILPAMPNKDEEPEHPGGEYEDEDKKEFPEDSEQK